MAKTTNTPTASSPRQRRLKVIARRLRADAEQRLRKVMTGQLAAADFLGLRTTDAPGFVGFALQMLDENDLDSAASAAELATAADPRSFEAWMTLGATRARAKEERTALAAYARAAELNSTDVRLWCDVGELKLLLQDYSGAAKALKLAMDADPKADTPAGRRAQALVAKTYAKLQQNKK